MSKVVFSPKLSPQLNYTTLLLSVFSIFFVARLIFLLDIDEDKLSIPVLDFINLFANLELFALARLPEFRNFSDLTFSNLLANLHTTANVYAAISLSIFLIGLMIFHRNMTQLPFRYCGLMLLVMGWMHLLAAKLVLLSSLPILLTGPVLAVGLISVVYFSIPCFFIEIIYLLKRKGHQ